MTKHSSKSVQQRLSDQAVSAVIGLAWCDKTSFDTIASEYGLCEMQVKNIMRAHLKPSSYRLWRARVSGRQAKHSKRLSLRRR